MTRIFDVSIKCILGCAIALSCTVLPQSALAETVLYSFAGGANDAALPAARLIRDGAGNLYGTTDNGGANAYNSGTVFKILPDGAEVLLYSFAGGSDGSNPCAGLMRDSKGNLFGTTFYGGAYGNGAVFKLAPDGTETVLYSFTGGSDGSNPCSDLIEGTAHNLYGTTEIGGALGYGTVFKLAPNGTETVLHSFAGGSDGARPVAGLTTDNAGNFYGTTYVGGAASSGTVFKLAPDGTETVLHSFFATGKDGAYPYTGDLIRDSAGNLFGTTQGGGTYLYGTVFKLAPDGTETVLHSFTGGSDGKYSDGGLVEDSMDNLYGTTVFGGRKNAGTVFKLAPDGTVTVLHSFTGGSDGVSPSSGLINDKKGRLYGTTFSGGGSANCSYNSFYGCGTVFKLKE